jgi:hypothetical protein
MNLNFCPERLCQHCSHYLIENELHFVLECTLYNSPRLELLDNLFQKFPNLRNINLENLLICIMSNEDLDFNAVFSVFLDKTFQIRQEKIMQVIFNKWSYPFLYWFSPLLYICVHVYSPFDFYKSSKKNS